LCYCNRQLFLAIATHCAEVATRIGLYCQYIYSLLCPEDFTIIYECPHHFGDAGSGSGSVSEGNEYLDQSEKQDPDQHQSENVEALEGHFKALEGPNLEKRVVE
jgi:hypothetical protein